MQRVLNLTHFDFDGLAAAIAIANAHPTDHVTLRIANYGDVHAQLKRALTAPIPYDRIILSDISIKTPQDINAKTMDADLVRELHVLTKEFVAAGGDFVVLDHHETALSMLEGYEGLLHEDSIIETMDDEGVKRAGSELGARYLRARFDALSDDIQVYMEISEAYEELGWSMTEEAELFERIYELCEIAGDRDVWRDPLGFGGRLALAIDTMDDTLGAYVDLNELVQVAAGSKCSFEEALECVPNLAYYYDLANDSLDEELERSDLEKVEYHSRFHKIETKFFPSDCAMNVYDKTKGVVLVMYPNSPNRLSFRRHLDCGVDLSAFCKAYGGGGHSVAAGLTLPDGVTMEEVVAAMRAEVERVSRA